MLRNQTLTECRKRENMKPAHSNGKPGVPTTTLISVRFAPFSTFKFEIKELHENIFSNPIDHIGAVAHLGAERRSLPPFMPWLAVRLHLLI